MSESSPLHRLVVASAGTGKTYRLTVELLRRLRQGARPEEVLAATFTRKAAGEILERLLVRLAEACLDPEARDRLAVDLGGSTLTQAEARGLLGVVVDSLDRVQVSTLDAFFHRMLLGFRVELGMTAVPLVLPPEDPRAVAVHSRALALLLEELAEGDFEELLRLLDRLRDGRARRPVVRDLGRLLTEMQAVLREAPDRAQWSGPSGQPMGPSGQPMGPSGQPMGPGGQPMGPSGQPMGPGGQPTGPGGQPSGASAGERLAGELHRLAELGLHPMPKGARSAWRKDLSQAQAHHWRAFLAGGLAGKLQAGERHYRRWRIPPAIEAAYRPLLEHARGALLGRVSERTQATYELIGLYDRCYGEQMRRAAVVLFGDVAHRLAHEMPSLHPERLGEIYYRLDSAVSHLLLDEFQDTSLDQWRVLAPFADEIWSYGDGSRSFFCVGDPKQAIYGWRGGCAGLFDLVEQRLLELGSGAETLQRNYRSSPVVLDAVAAVFEGLRSLPEASRPEASGLWLGDFVPVEAAHPERQGHVVLHRVVVTTTSVESESESESESEDAGPEGEEQENAAVTSERPLFSAVADRVQELLGRQPEARVGVLARTNRTASLLLDALRRRGLPASGEGGGLIVDDPSVTVVLAALQVAEHPSDRAAAFHVASSPLGKTLGFRSTEDSEALSKRLRARVQSHGLARVVAELAGGLASVVDRKGAVRLAQLLELGRRFEAAGEPGIGAFVELARTARVEEPQAARVRVMTVHRAKGLEFDAVVLCELERRPAAPAERLVWLDRPAPTEPPRHVFRSVDAQIRALDAGLERAYQQELQRLQLDDLSALYVALTRARHVLHVIIEQSPDGELPGGSWASILLSTLAPGASPAPEAAIVRGEFPSEVLYEGGDAGWQLEGSPSAMPTRASRHPLDVSDVAIPRARRSPGRTLRDRRSTRELDGTTAGGGPREWLRLDSDDQRKRGSLFHAWLAAVEWLPAGPEWERSLPERGRLLAIGRSLLPGASQSWLEGEYRRWLRALRLPGVRDAFTAPAELNTGLRLALWRERSFALELEGELAVGRFDRVSILSKERTGEMVGVRLWDFKSERPAGTVAERSRVEQLQLAQLASYRHALERITGAPASEIRARLLYLDSGETRSLAE